MSLLRDRPGKAVVLLDGNQPGLGKTLLARVIGIILDGIDPQLIHYTPDDEELAKRICATLRGSPQSVLLIDNAKVKAGGAVTSPVIEANIDGARRSRCGSWASRPTTPGPTTCSGSSR